MGRPAQEDSAQQGAREGRREGAGGPGSPRVVPSGTRLSVTRFTVWSEHAARARVRGERRGARARFAEDAVRRAHVQPHGSRWTARAREGKRRERLAGHAGRREVEEDAGRNGRRTAATKGGANHGDTGESEHTGWLFETRGDEPTARIHRRELDGSELRQRQPAERKGENGDEVTRGRFPARRAHGERRQQSGRRRLATGRVLVLLPESKGRRWIEEEERREALPSGRGAVTMGRRHGSDLSGLGLGKRKKRARPESPSVPLLVPAPPTRATTNGDGEQSTGGGDNGVEAMGQREEKRGRAPGLYRMAMSVWERGTDFERSSQRAGAPASGQIGDKEEGGG
uniref:Epstein-Barr virus EBNA-1-like protein n=1 Tax=Oryza sativa subsp. japonica TaxID=39947 RepID=Q6Z3T7_ORYSJ|nr:Epstein-Barr virus EBNA-1-like protein [Oryza sativa Japonica Group]BAD10177.1 Epstein-Barr virus EBNA-1-like protein [Oryza sativa Japonica Group]